ncbi:MAG: cell wall-active antibiotics response protein [Firmicutes bacterium]|jgi:hypothetical protein|nr:cell wall-active antibiotics response protein [Bacillota bacterium]
MRLISFRGLLGLFLVLLGVVIILNRVAGVDIELGTIWSYWPVIPLLLGLQWIALSFNSSGSKAERRISFSWGQFISGLLLAAIGVIFLGRKFWPEYFDFDLSLFWPVVGAAFLILLGISLLRGRPASGAGGRMAFMGGLEVGGSSPWRLESGSYLAFMGGIDVDLTRAEIPPGETVLDLTAIMGGIDVKIPPGLAVIYEGSSFLGGTTFKDREDGGIISGHKVKENLEGADRILRLQARAVLGGIEIREKI